jgi:NAD(P)-dependent dehydrogenase (short-subunit alcohol dehydrogenase family)
VTVARSQSGEMPEQYPIVITGASSGIGRAAAWRLARQNRPVVLLCRESPRARSTHAEIVRATGNRSIELETADLSVKAEVRKAAEAIRTRHPRLGGLVNNAGVSYAERHLSADGIEMNFAVNHLAAFLLTNLLLDNLKAGAPSRVLTISSDLQRPLRLDDLDRKKKPYDPFEVYGETKLANVLFTFELARRLTGTKVTANALAPGFLRTGLMRDAKLGTRFLFALMSVFMMESADKGGDRVVHLMTAPDLAGTSGEYFVKSQPGKASAPAYDKALAAQLWAISERMVGLVPSATAEQPG